MRNGIKTENVNKIAITGDRNHPLISAILSLSREERETLEKAVYVELWDGYPLHVYEIPQEDENNAHC